MTAAALHAGQRLTVDGMLLFETNSWGQAVLTFSEEAVEAQLDLYDSRTVRVRSPRPPARVLVNRKERPFEYESQTRCVRVDSGNVREVKIILQQQDE